MKRWHWIVIILLAGVAGAFWFAQPNSPWRISPGRNLSPQSLARIRISGGGGFAVAIAPDGSLWSWGDVGSALGQGNITQPVKVPQRIGQDNDWVEVSAGYSYSVAIKRDGSLWAWGSNPSGALGDGTTQARDTPTRVGTETNWLQAAPGLHHSAGLKRDGTLWAWGANDVGTLGSSLVAASGSNMSFVPVQVGTETNWKALAVGALANAAIRGDGTLWTWGDASRSPQFASGPAANNFAPIQLGTETNWVAVAAGYYHLIALQDDGSLWSWGRNGHLINGIPAKDPSQPRRYGTGTNWAAILPGPYGHFVRMDDSSWWQLGGPNGRIQVVSWPGQWSALASGPKYSLAVTSDGSLWHWGEILGAKKQPGWFNFALGQVLNAMGRKNNFNQTTTPTRKEPELIFQLPGGQPDR